MSREMKDSGIPWIGKVPKSWTIELIGNQVKSVDNPNINGEEDNALQFKMGTIISKSKGDSKYNPETLEGYNIVDKGVIMLNGLNLSFDFISQRVGLVKEKGVITSTYLAVKPTQSIDSEYLTYLFKSYDNCKAFHGMGRGLRQTLSYGELRKHLLIYPILEEQQKIAKFLDKKCSEVDEMIALQEQIIEELKAYKQSVITEAVTKGLNPNVPMKDSGIEWIGEIPEHWEVKRLKYVSNISRGLFNHRPRNDERYYGGIHPFIQTGDVARSNKYIKSYSQTLSDLGISVSKLFPKGTLTMTIAANVGDVSILGFNAYFPDSVLGIIPVSGVDNIFLYYALKAMKGEFVNAAILSTQLNLNVERVYNMKAVMPPFSEQQQIASYLDNKCPEIDYLIALKLAKIEELKEYKKSIIYEYVTGKKEVV